MIDNYNDFSIKEIITLEQEIEKLITLLQKEICCKISQSIITGVSKVNENPNIITISFSNLDNTNLSASYYNMTAQANIVRTALQSAKNMNAIQSKLKNMIENRYVIVNKVKEVLNPATIKILSDYLNQFN